jgi:CubicO group peptidase (beta-lactamase class C family)
MSDGPRGEVTFELAGKTHTILLTNRVLASVEKATGKSVLQLARGSVDETFGMNDAATMLRAGLEAGRVDAQAGGPQVTMADAWDVLNGLGFVRVMQLLMTALAAVLQFHGSEGESPN